MSNSSLINYTKLSPNCTKPRNAKIKKITIHHMAGNLTIEACGKLFASKSRQASSNYGIGSDGRIGMYVEEKNRSWCSSSKDNDHQAITIEVANDGGAKRNWHVSDKAIASLIELCVDICKRNDIEKLEYTGDKNGNLTRHNMFANTNCPGPYLQSKFPYIVKEVNNRLAPQDESKPLENVEVFKEPTISDKELLELVKKTIRGDFGNGDNRKKALGKNYDAVQKQVNLNFKNKTTEWDNIKLY